MVLINACLIMNLYNLMFGFTARSLVGVNIIFKVRVKYVIDNGFAQNKVNLFFGHSGFKCIKHILGDYVALLDVYFINAWKRASL